MVLVCLTGFGIYAAIGPMWALMTEVVPRQTAGLSLGLINAVANLGGMAGPYFVGAAQDATGSFLTGFIFLGCSLITAGLLTLMIPKFEYKVCSA